jgi:uracil-DNA glycosylase
MNTLEKLSAIHHSIKKCRACPNMCGSPVHGPVLDVPVMLVGQAPGIHEGELGKPFAYTAGKTLFKWFSTIGINEDEFRDKVYITATARCFPGKSGKGDRVPTKDEIAKCSVHVAQEVEALRPKLIIAVGRLAITEVLGQNNFTSSMTLADVVGKKFKSKFHGHEADVICLPHPSGVSRWPRTTEGEKLLNMALSIIQKHHYWQ